MDTIKNDIMKFNKDIVEFHIPRWEELPDIELYMDQVITFIENNLSIYPFINNEKIITSSMINNYVKLNLIPKPVKKKYNKTHLAYLIAISILKHVFTIQEVKDGILFQAMISGEKDAYNLFCEEQELALKYITEQINGEDKTSASTMNITSENLMIKMSTLSFASKIISEKTIGLQKCFMEKNEE